MKFSNGVTLVRCSTSHKISRDRHSRTVAEAGEFLHLGVLFGQFGFGDDEDGQPLFDGVTDGATVTDDLVFFLVKCRSTAGVDGATEGAEEVVVHGIIPDRKLRIDSSLDGPATPPGSWGMGAADLGYRCAQPQANGCNPFGIKPIWNTPSG